jgi:hypothetical protein
VNVPFVPGHLHEIPNEFVIQTLQEARFFSHLGALSLGLEIAPTP